MLDVETADIQGLLVSGAACRCSYAWQQGGCIGQVVLVEITQFLGVDLFHRDILFLIGRTGHLDLAKSENSLVQLYAIGSAGSRLNHDYQEHSGYKE